MRLTNQAKALSYYEDDIQAKAIEKVTQKRGGERKTST